MARLPRPSTCARPPAMPTSRNLPARPHRSQRGFTLVEVLVALGIVAVALGAGVQASAALTRHAQRQLDQTLAQVCAENALVTLRLQRQLPAVGDSDLACDQAGRKLRVDLSVRPTPNPNFRRVDAQVRDGTDPIWRLSTVLGRF